jgi:putative heme iron utilization protein
MDADTATSLRQLLASQPVAALATLHRGEPAVSMVPFALAPGGSPLIIHVSGLATHTADMLAHPRVSLLVMDESRADVTAQARARVSLHCEAQVLPREGEVYGQARADYLARFPDSAITFELGDFRVVLLRPVAARLVAGFGRAYSLVGAQLEGWLRGVEVTSA